MLNEGIIFGVNVKDILQKTHGRFVAPGIGELLGSLEKISDIEIRPEMREPDEESILVRLHRQVLRLFLRPQGCRLERQENQKEQQDQVAAGKPPLAAGVL